MSIRSLAMSIVKIAVDCVCGVILVLLLVTAGCWWQVSRPVAQTVVSASYGVALKTLGRSQCPLTETMAVARNREVLDASAATIAAQLQLLRTDGRFEEWQSPIGSFWIVAPRHPLFHYVAAEQQQWIYGRWNVRPGDIILDCGADYGTFTRQALAAGARIVVAIEPEPGKQAAMQRTFASELSTGRVVLYRKGVWDREDTLILHGDTLVLNAHGRGIQVPLTTIDRIVSELRLPRVDLVKMDVEGAEARALAGAAETLRRWRPRLSIASEHLPDDAKRLPEVVRQICPQYEVSCGWCQYSADAGEVRPEVLYFNAN